VWCRDESFFSITPGHDRGLPRFDFSSPKIGRSWCGVRSCATLASSYVRGPIEKTKGGSGVKISTYSRDVTACRSFSRTECGVAMPSRIRRVRCPGGWRPIRRLASCGCIGAMSRVGAAARILATRLASCPRRSSGRAHRSDSEWTRIRHILGQSKGRTTARAGRERVRTARAIAG
jgi:hypothetical protein